MELSLQWDDSIENSSEESPDQGSRIKLPSPKRRRVSPLISNGSEQPKKRRRVGKWSADEEDALRTGVEEYVIVCSCTLLLTINI